VLYGARYDGTLHCLFTLAMFGFIVWFLHIRFCTGRLVVLSWRARCVLLPLVPASLLSSVLWSKFFTNVNVGYVVTFLCVYVPITISLYYWHGPPAMLLWSLGHGEILEEIRAVLPEARFNEERYDSIGGVPEFSSIRVCSEERTDPVSTYVKIAGIGDKSHIVRALGAKQLTDRFSTPLKHSDEKLLTKEWLVLVWWPLALLGIFCYVRHFKMM